MRVMVFVKGGKEYEEGQMPSQKLLARMAKYNEDLVKAGIMQDGGGLHPTRGSKKVSYNGSVPAIIDGPFAETKELVAGFWIWKVKSLDEALEWLKKAPFDG